MSELHKNHRDRMDRKADLAGLYNLPDHEVLEMLLFAVVPRGNTNETAEALCRRFGGIAGVLQADMKDLMEVEGVGKSMARFLHNLPEVLGVVERSLNFPSKRIASRQEAQAYVKTFFNGKLSEQFYMISLTSTGHIITHNKLGDGVTDEVHIYARNIAKMAIKNEAHSVIIAHNHPGGTIKASFQDIKFTEDIFRILDILNIELYDSIIVARGETGSILDDPACSIKRF